MKQSIAALVIAVVMGCVLAVTSGWLVALAVAIPIGLILATRFDRPRRKT